MKMNNGSLEELLRMTFIAPGMGGEAVEISPEFRVAVQEVSARGVRIIIHANGHDSNTLDFWVAGDSLGPVG